MKSSTLETGHKLDKQDIARFISRNRGDFNDLFLLNYLTLNYLNLFFTYELAKMLNSLITNIRSKINHA